MRNQRGAVYVEFLIVFLPLFTLFLGIAQAALMYSAELGVRHAAMAAARSASVVLDDDKARYDGEARLEIAPESDCGSQGPGQVLAPMLEAVGAEAVPGMSGSSCSGGARAGVIKAAAIAKMLPFAPPIQTLFTDGPWGALAGFAGKVAYAAAATSVTFPESPGSDRFVTSFRGKSRVRTRVTYLHHCPIPVVSLLMCDRTASLALGLDLETLKRDDLESRINVQRRLRDAHPAYAELARDSSLSPLLFAMMASSSRFAVLQAEASLPIHAAPYPYRSDL